MKCVLLFLIVLSTACETLALCYSNIGIFRYDQSNPIWTGRKYKSFNDDYTKEQELLEHADIINTYQSFAQIFTKKIIWQKIYWEYY